MMRRIEDKVELLRRSLEPMGYEIPGEGISTPSTLNLEHLYRLKITFLRPSSEGRWLKQEAEILRVLRSCGLTIDVIQAYNTYCRDDECVFTAWFDKDTLEALLDPPTPRD